MPSQWNILHFVPSLAKPKNVLCFWLLFPKTHEVPNLVVWEVGGGGWFQILYFCPNTKFQCARPHACVCVCVCVFPLLAKPKKHKAPIGRGGGGGVVCLLQNTLHSFFWGEEVRDLCCNFISFYLIYQKDKNKFRRFTSEHITPAFVPVKKCRNQRLWLSCWYWMCGIAVKTIQYSGCLSLQTMLITRAWNYTLPTSIYR